MKRREKKNLSVVGNERCERKRMLNEVCRGRNRRHFVHKKLPSSSFHKRVAHLICSLKCERVRKEPIKGGKLPTHLHTPCHNCCNFCFESSVCSQVLQASVGNSSFSFLLRRLFSSLSDHHCGADDAAFCRYLLLYINLRKGSIPQELKTD